MKTQILVDNPGSWVMPYAQVLQAELGDNCRIVHDHDAVDEGDVLLMLSCEKLFKHYDRNCYNLVVHASDLPQGKGWSPLTWQILEGKDSLVVSLFEAADKVDSGVVYFKEVVQFDGGELIDELRKKIEDATTALMKRFAAAYPDVQGKPQEGEESFYPRRTPEDARLDINKTIEEQFNLLRISDNERYPAYFERNGRKYTLKIDEV